MSTAPEPSDSTGSILDRSGLANWSTVYTDVAPLVCPPSTETLKLLTDIFVDAQILRDGDTSILNNLLNEIQAGYNNTPYHNFTHAVHVFLGTYVLLRQSLIDWRREERAALLFTAIIHDLEHQGVPNVQLVKEGSPIAAKYANLSVAENNSFDKAFALLGNESTNIFAHFSGDEYARFRDLCKHIILATDIADGARIKDLYARVERGIASWAAAGACVSESASKLDTSSDENRTLMLCLFMKLADVGAPLQHLETSRLWAHRFYDECRQAGKLDRGAPVDHASFKVNQGKFYDSYLRHLVEVVESTGGLPRSVTTAMHGNLDALKAEWEAESHKWLEEWSEQWR
jgi:hypothetical protein